MKDVIKQVEEVLKKAGYAHLHTSSSEHFHTLSGDKGDARFVAHITDRDEVPTGTGRNTKAVPTMHIKATLPSADLLSLALPGQVVRAAQSDTLEATHDTENVCQVC